MILLEPMKMLPFVTTPQKIWLPVAIVVSSTTITKSGSPSGGPRMPPTRGWAKSPIAIQDGRRGACAPILPPLSAGAVIPERTGPTLLLKVIGEDGSGGEFC